MNELQEIQLIAMLEDEHGDRPFSEMMDRRVQKLEVEIETVDVRAVFCHCLNEVAIVEISLIDMDGCSRVAFIGRCEKCGRWYYHLGRAIDVQQPSSN